MQKKAAQVGGLLYEIQNQDDSQMSVRILYRYSTENSES